MSKFKLGTKFTNHNMGYVNMIILISSLDDTDKYGILLIEPKDWVADLYQTEAFRFETIEELVQFIKETWGITEEDIIE